MPTSTPFDAPPPSPLLPRTRTSLAILVALLGVTFLGGMVTGAALWQAIVHASPSLRATPGQPAATMSVPIAEPTPSVDDVRTAILAQVNRQRQDNALPPLQVNSRLNDAAEAKLKDMVAKQYWSHYSPDGASPFSFILQAGYDYRVAGENLARGYATAEAVVLGWMGSPEHRANVLNPRYTETGIAVHFGPFMDKGGILVVNDYGARDQ